MDPIPQIPTDNLYKFLAISGIAIVGFTAAFPLRMSRELTFKTVQYATDMHKYAIERKYIASEYQDLTKKTQQLAQEWNDTLASMEKAYANANSGKPYSVPKNPDKQLKIDLDITQKKLDEISFKANLKQAELDGKKQELDLMNDEINFINIFSAIGLFLGILLAWSGFYYWYHRVQKIQDIVLTNQVNASNPETQNAELSNNC